MSAISYLLAKTLFGRGAGEFESADGNAEPADWTDLGGQLVESSLAERLHSAILSDGTTLSDISAILSEAASMRAEAEYRHAVAVARKLSITSFDEIRRRGSEAAQMFMTMLADDAAREMRLANPGVTDEEIAASPAVTLVRRHFSTLPFMKA